MAFGVQNEERKPHQLRLSCRLQTAAPEDARLEPPVATANARSHYRPSHCGESRVVRIAWPISTSRRKRETKMRPCCMTEPDPFDFSTVSKALIVGAGHGIGLAAVEWLVRETSATIYATYRSPGRASDLLVVAGECSRVKASELDPTDEKQLEALARTVSDHSGELTLILNCVGVLHDEHMQPEKTLRTISGEQLLRSFQVNAVVTPLLAKHFHRLLKGPDLSVFASLSAKVGSIEDNRLGGWYGYRASKAALNMFIRTIAIEFANTRSNCIALALHPGTTRTALSEPFIARTRYTVHSPSATVENIFSVIQGRRLQESGSFFSWDGTSIPW
jgi:NAD(P)-dependent dehydrogenase (short-subunit alcohol dehydrogenase family)